MASWGQSPFPLGMKEVPFGKFAITVMGGTGAEALRWWRQHLKREGFLVTLPGKCLSEKQTARIWSLHIMD